MTEKAFTTYDIQSCLFDEHRVEHLRKAIERTVRPGAVVVDAGSGTGLLGMLAAKAGAARVYCLELNSEFIPVIRENARRNGLADRIIPVRADATSHHLDEQVDVIVSEVISAGFFYEPQLQIINNLLGYLKPGGAIVPLTMKNYVELLNAQEGLYGLTFNFDSRFVDLPKDEQLTKAALYLTTDFSTRNSAKIEARVPVSAVRAGSANAVRITYEIEFAPGQWVNKPTQFLLNPQIIFLDQPMPLHAGERYEIGLAYQASDSPLGCKLAVRQLGRDGR